MDILVPFDAQEPKTRLAPVLDGTERAEFARAMLRDVLDVIDDFEEFDDLEALTAPAAADSHDDSQAPGELDDRQSFDAVPSTDAGRRNLRGPTVLANAPVDVDAPVTVDERPLTAAVNRVLRERLGESTPSGGPVTVVMADLALATPAALARLFEPDSDVVVAPGRGGGTNALVVDHPAFRVDYHGASYRDHRKIAADVGASVAVVDSFRLTTDVDEPADLAEVLLHAPPGGAARKWLRDAGFELVVSEGRVEVGRPGVER